MSKVKLKDRKRYKTLNNYRKNPSDYIPYHNFYCYGMYKNGKYDVCKFLMDRYLNSYLDKTRKYDRYDLKSAKCCLTGKWIFDYCKHCNINKEFKLDKKGVAIW